MNAVGEFGDTYTTENRLPITDPGGHEFQKLRNNETLPLSFDQNARIDDYSQDGGSHGRPRSAIPS